MSGTLMLVQIGHVTRLQIGILHLQTQHVNPSPGKTADRTFAKTGSRGGTNSLGFMPRKAFTQDFSGLAASDSRTGYDASRKGLQ